MGSCLSKTKFQGEGRTLNEASSAAWSAATTQGQRLGSAGGPTTQPMPSPSVLGSSTPATDREARAQAAERRINAQAAKGTPTHGKLSQQLMHNKSAHPLTQNQDEPHRVIVSLQTPHYTPLKSLLRQPQPCPPTHLSCPPSYHSGTKPRPRLSPPSQAPATYPHDPSAHHSHSSNHESVYSISRVREETRQGERTMLYGNQECCSDVNAKESVYARREQYEKNRS